MMYTPARTSDTSCEELLEPPSAAVPALPTKKYFDQRKNTLVPPDIRLPIGNIPVAHPTRQNTVKDLPGGGRGVHTSSRLWEIFKDWLSESFKGHPKPQPKLVRGILIINGGSQSSMRVTIPANIEPIPSSTVSKIRIKGPTFNKRKTMGAVLIPESLATRQALPGDQLTLEPHTRQHYIQFKGKDLELCELIQGTCKLDGVPLFPKYMTMAWYLAIVKDDDNVLNGKAFIPWELFRDRPSIPTCDRQVSFPV